MLIFKSVHKIDSIKIIQEFVNVNPLELRVITCFWWLCICERFASSFFCSTMLSFYELVERLNLKTNYGFVGHIFFLNSSDLLLFLRFVRGTVRSS